MLRIKINVNKMIQDFLMGNPNIGRAIMLERIAQQYINKLQLELTYGDADGLMIICNQFGNWIATLYGGDISHAVLDNLADSVHYLVWAK